MQNKWLWLLVPGMLIGASGCPDINTDSGEGVAGPTVEFDPSRSIVPFPNNLVLDPTTGKVNLPSQCGETASATATRENVLNKLDGFGTYQLGMRVTFTEAVDPATLAGNVVLYKRAAGATASDPTTATLIPVTTRVGETTRFDAECMNPAQVNSVTIIPLVPLDQKSTYTAAIMAGVKTATGSDFVPSFTWSLIRQSTDPVTFDAEGNLVENRTPLDPLDPAQAAQIFGIDLLWKAHARALTFLEGTGHLRADVLVGWEFTTQTVTDPLDPAVAGSPAAMVATGALLGVTSLTCDFDATTCPKGINRGAAPYSQCTDPNTAAGNTQCFLKISIGASAAEPGSSLAVIYGTGVAACAQLGCAAVRDVVAGGLVSRSYQVENPAVIAAPTTGPNVGNPNFGGPIPGAWDDPVHPTFVKNNIIQVLAMLPAAGVRPAVVFGHGFTSSKKTVFAIGSQLAANGFASVAIDYVGHDSRAVRISTDAAKGCADDVGTGAAPDPTGTLDPRTTACYAPLLSADLGSTRDGIRQTVLDLQGLVAALKTCGAAGCLPMQIDPAHITYSGISLGGILGAMAVATQPDLTAAVLNVPGVGWGDTFENTQRNDFRCPLVDALIDSGLLTGDKSVTTGTSPRTKITSGLCTTDAWKTQPGYAQFAATIRWVLDPADGANFGRMLAPRKFMIQEVVGDTVVPNIATDRAGALVGLTAADADPVLSPTPAASAAICSPCTAPTTSKFIKYPTITTPSPSTFWHGSLLKPLGVCTGAGAERCTSSLDCPGVESCASAADGGAGTLRLQTDAITFLSLNK